MVASGEGASVTAPLTFGVGVVVSTECGGASAATAAAVTPPFEFIISLVDGGCTPDGTAAESSVPPPPLSIVGLLGFSEGGIEEEEEETGEATAEDEEPLVWGTVGEVAVSERQKVVLIEIKYLR